MAMLCAKSDLGPPEIAAGLAIPAEVAPARAQVIGKDEAFEVGTAEILEMNRSDCLSDHMSGPDSWPAGMNVSLPTPAPARAMYSLYA